MRNILKHSAPISLFISHVLMMEPPKQTKTVAPATWVPPDEKMVALPKKTSAAIVKPFEVSLPTQDDARNCGDFIWNVHIPGWPQEQSYWEDRYSAADQKSGIHEWFLPYLSRRQSQSPIRPRRQRTEPWVGIAAGIY